MEEYDEKILRLPAVMEKVGLSRSAIYHLMSVGKFPKTIKLGMRRCGWLNSELNAWIAERVRARSGD